MFARVAAQGSQNHECMLLFALLHRSPACVSIGVLTDSGESCSLGDEHCYVTCHTCKDCSSRKPASVMHAISALMHSSSACVGIGVLTDSGEVMSTTTHLDMH